MTHGTSRFRQVMSRLKLRHLRLIDAIAEAKSISAAADTFNITQPAVSKGLREIEGILGVPLFVRRPEGLMLTPAGRSVVAHGKVIQSQVRHVTEEIEAIASGVSGLVTVGAMMVSLPGLLPTALRLLRDRDNKTPIRVIQGSDDVLLQGLRSGAIDFIVGRLTPVDTADRMAQEVLRYEPIVVVSAPHHPLATKARVSDQELAQADWILPPPQSVVYGPVMQLFAQYGHSKPNAFVESTSFLLLRTLLFGNELVAALPLSVVQRDLDRGDLVTLPVAFPHEALAVGITKAIDRTLATGALQFISCLRDAARSLATIGREHHEASAKRPMPACVTQGRSARGQRAKARRRRS